MKKFKLFSLVFMLLFSLTLAACKDKPEDTTDNKSETIQAALDNIDLGDLSGVLEDFTLPASDENGTTFAWTSSDETVLEIDEENNLAIVHRPEEGQDDVEVTLTVTGNIGIISESDTFTVKVLAFPEGEALKLAEAKKVLDLPLHDFDEVIEPNFVAPVKSHLYDQISITWAIVPKTDLTEPADDASDDDKAYYNNYDESVVSLGSPTNEGLSVTVNRPSNADKNVRLVATLTIVLADGVAEEQVTKEFELVVKQTPADDAGKVAEAITLLQLWGLDIVMSDITLPTTGHYDTDITWASNNTDVISISSSGDTGVVTRPNENTAVTLTATVATGSESQTKSFVAIVVGTDSTFTYRTTTTNIDNINPQFTTDAREGDMIDYMTAGLFEGDFDWAASGVSEGDFSNAAALEFNYLPTMAAEMPIDVHADDADKAGTVWQVKLRDDLRWQDDPRWADGTWTNTDPTIDVDDFMYAYKMLLDPKLLNGRASVLYSDIPVVNAETYYKQGTGYKGCDVTVETTDDAGATTTETSLDTSIVEEDCVDTKVDTDNGETARTKVDWPATFDFANVGIKKIDNLTFEFTLESAMTSWDFREQLASGITGPVHEELYEAGMNDTRTKTTYGTNVNEILAYGEFKLNSWQDDVNLYFEKNEHFIEADEYNFDFVRVDLIEDQGNRIEEFKKGRLDVVGAGGKYYPDFKDHPNIKLSPVTTTFRWATNIGERGDGNTNPMMKYDKFRQAIYYAVDREEMSATVNSPSIAQQGLLSPEYVIHYTETQSYRSTDQGKSVFDGKSPETTGYNPTLAKQLFEEAYAEAVAAGDITDGDEVYVELSMLDAESNWTSNEWVKSKIEEALDALPGGSNADKFEFKIQPYSSEALNGAVADNNFDIVFYGWTGVKFDPIALMGWVWNENFAYMHENGWTPGAWDITVDLPNYNAGKDITTETRTFNEWFEATQSGGDLYDPYPGFEEDLLNICAAMEKALIDEVIAIPLFTSVNTAAYSDRVVFENPEYHPWMGWGGMKYMYLNQSDQEIKGE
ncbi:ABC transporter substrate-binding protein [Haloplasma contractile]|uniref:ABC oligopeptide transporter perplasmic substrate-binding protein OppA n=1 Tax=Haloplasma contractile SSD-17B TaxID=1033810 RepID=U2FQ17_9MOLU|nr:ABC transporter substrate-binding protein [Haloplasma contractile]ERJ13139.1 ABC oligopeptide transporter perplasmic substrate-binding protein OppA [Haloplasma contractile SSD-17B]